ncbi:MAG: PAS domain-containing sensor histidine kinase [Pedobacter sp.]|nr:MAG: PAS domain-containing sensor histidine kinase [Pedobacter sp.]
MAISNPHLYLADRSSELFFIFDLQQDQFTYMNKACLDFFGLENINIRSRLLLNMIHPEDRGYLLFNLKKCIDGDSVSDVECRVESKKKHQWLSITPFLANENSDRLLIGQAKDITSVKAKTEVLNNHNIKKNSILSILAHDLAGPIGVIGSLSTLLAQDTENLKNSSIDRNIEFISKISKSSIKLIRDFLDQEFLESSQVHLFKVRVELTEKIKSNMEKYIEMQNNLKINFSYDSNKPKIYAEIDEDKFMQVINNLISNALKFTPDGGNISLYVEENKKKVLVSIADNGIGIPEKYHSILFDKFSAARRNGLKGEHSTGLGMSIIKTIVEWHEGRIWFESVENKGTTFYIEIPKA